MAFALFTLQWFYSTVGPIVLDKNRAVCKGLSTFIALIGLLTSVYPRVFNKGRAVTKGLPTFIAPIGLLTSVNPHVFN